MAQMNEPLRPSIEQANGSEARTLRAKCLTPKALLGAGVAVSVVIICIVVVAVVAGGSATPVCPIKDCTSVSMPAGSKDCRQATCASCSEGKQPYSDSEGSYCGLDCPLEHCHSVARVARGATSCSHAAPQCAVCEKGFELDLDRKTLLPKGGCRFACTSPQQVAGCAPHACNADNSCTQCVPGFKLASSKFLGAGSGCVKESQSVPMTFYMYRAQSGSTYPPENCNLASASGVMWYLHNEVVRICPRKFDISRILRYNVTVYNPSQVFAVRAGQFGHFTQFDSGKCTVDSCEDFWSSYGYMVGCQPQAETFHYHNSFWYSLPGSCPDKDFTSKTDACKQSAPGGKCDNPNGNSTCTWHAEPAGEVSIDDLSGIKDFDQFCASGNVEYDPNTDAGRGTSFWNDRNNNTRNADRVLKLMQLFARNVPVDDAMAMPDPLCDGF